jgi:aromatic-amino-acid transaminase
MLDRLQPQPADALLALIKLHAADPRPGKIDLGVGVYRDADGGTPVFRAVKAAEERLVHEQDSKAYLGPEGDREFVAALMPYAFGPASPHAERIAGVQTPGGTGAVRLALALVKKAGGRRILLGTPSWPNHVQIVEDLGLEPVLFEHPRSDGTANIDALLDLIRSGGAGDTVLLHASCHNPTGTDYAPEQWDAIAEALSVSGVFPVIDMAYQGLGHGMDEDAQGARRVVDTVPQALLAYSCDKNFGLYRDRVGALYMMAASPVALDAITSNANALARATWSMPPDHGAAAVRLILADEALTRDWLAELTSMQQRIRHVRDQLAAADNAVPGVGLAALQQGNGLFAMLNLDKPQIDRLRDDHAIYMAGSGRINIAGLTEENTGRFLAALADVAG